MIMGIKTLRRHHAGALLGLLLALGGCAAPADPGTGAACCTPTIIPAPTPIPADLVLIGATLIDGNGGPPIPNAAVAIRGAQIVAIGRAGELPIDPAAQQIDLAGATLLPGLVNAHAHTDTLEDAELRAFTRAGITTVRDMAGPLTPLAQRVAAIAEDPSMPRLRIAGPMLTVPGGHPLPVYGESEEVLAVADEEQARAAVRALIDGGVHHIKIAVSGRTDVAWPELTDAQIRAIVVEAHSRDTRVTAHIDRASALRRALEAGVDDAGHMPRDRIPDDLIALMVERGMALIPTIDVYENLAEGRGGGDAWRRTTLPIMEDNLRRFVAAGGTLALGDDYGNPGVALGFPADEVEKWLGAGLTPMQVIVAATRGGAIVCGLDGEIGAVEVGKRADLLIVDGDPLADLGVLQQVRLVLRDGQVAYQR